MRKAFSIVVLLVVVSSLTLIACGNDEGGDSPENVKIAVSVPMALGIGQDVVDALTLGLEQRDNKIGNVNVSLLVLDSSDPEGSPVSADVESVIAKEAVDDDAVIAYIGPMTTDQSKVSIPILNEAGIAQLTESATWPGLTKAGFGPGEPGIYYPTGRRTFFRVLPADDVQAIVGAQWMADLGFERVFVVSEGTSYGDGLSGIFEVAALDIGLTVVGRETLDPEALTPEDLAPVIEAISNATDVDIVYFGGGVVPGGLPFLPVLHEALPEMAVMGPDALFQDQVIDDLGDSVEGLYVTNPIVPLDQLTEAAEFVALYEETYGKEPQPYVVIAYAALESVVAAIEQADSPTREGVLTAMTELENISGIFGSWAFDSNGDTTFQTLSGWQIQNGEWMFVDIIE